MVESTARDVRINFSGLLEKSLSTLSSHGPDTNCSVGHIIRHIVSLLSDVGDNVKNSSQYFWFLFMYAQMVDQSSYSLKKLVCSLIRVLVNANSFLISGHFKIVFSSSLVSLYTRY